MPPMSMNMGKPSPQARSSRNIALMSIFGVVGGGYALFRAQSPREGIIKEDDIAHAGHSKLGRSALISPGDVEATHRVGRSPRQASSRGDI